MRVTQVSANKLLGVFDYRIDLNTEDRITIIHGPNGYGKTVLLTMLHSLFNGDLRRLAKRPFRSFAVQFDDGSKVTVEKPDGSGNRDLLVLSHIAPTGEILGAHKVRRRDSRHWYDTFVEETSQWRRIGPDRWIDPRGHIVQTPPESRLPLEHFTELEGPREKAVEWLDKLRQQVRVHFIDTQRLMARGREDRTIAVEAYAEELAGQIRENLARYAAVSQGLDRTFPARLVGLVRSSAPSETSEKLQDRLAALERRRARLTAVGLLDEGQVLRTPEIGDDTVRRVLTLYLEDTNSKLDVLQEGAKKLELFTKIINSKFKYKQMDLDRDRGFRFLAEGKIIPLDALSSGEQHEVVLFYQILFGIKQPALVLIDEPELSLHVAWQLQFLNDLAEMVGLVKHDFLIATHSPQIINDRWHLAVQLKGPDDA